MRSDVVIIGGGISGLATGALLAKQGKRVIVLEKGNQPGGRAYTYEDKGYTLNYGPHAMYRPDSGFLGELMGRLGRPVPHCGFPDPMRSYWSDGDRFAPLGSKPHQVLTAKLFSLRGRAQFGRMMLAVRSSGPGTGAGMTWREWVESKVSDRQVRRIAMAIGTLTTYCRPSGNLSAPFMLSQIKRNLFARDGAGYMDGGWRSMYDVFVEELRAHGGDLITGARVDHVEFDAAGNIIAAVTAAARYEAAVFVCTLPPQDAPAIAPPASPLAGELAQWSSLEDVRALCMDLGFSRPLRTDLTLVFDVERDLYFSVHSAVAAGLAPAGGWLMHAMAYLSPEEAADDALVAKRKAELIDGLDRYFAGWRDALVVERTLTNVRVCSARNTPHQFEQHRVPLRSSAVPNLYFAGDARDLPYNLAEVPLASAMQVADTLASATHEHPASPEPIAV